MVKLIKNKGRGKKLHLRQQQQLGGNEELLHVDTLNRDTEKDSVVIFKIGVN